MVAVGPRGFHTSPESSLVIPWGSGPDLVEVGVSSVSSQGDEGSFATEGP